MHCPGQGSHFPFYHRYHRPAQWPAGRSNKKEKKKEENTSYYFLNYNEIIAPWLRPFLSWSKNCCSPQMALVPLFASSPRSCVGCKHPTPLTPGFPLQSGLFILLLKFNELTLASLSAKRCVPGLLVNNKISRCRQRQ